MKLENPIYESDPYLSDFKPDLDRRHEKMAKTISSIEGNDPILPRTLISD